MRGGRRRRHRRARSRGLLVGAYLMVNWIFCSPFNPETLSLILASGVRSRPGDPAAWFPPYPQW
ncbi:MAG: hypothetical protein MZU79_01410 [Anaerotruncus sp.]|nr:hypothetical protein [Anaerotruncus sp.]